MEENKVTVEHTSFRKLDGCINTFSGLKFDILNPTVDMIDIEDIARGLAYKAHFGGQTPFFFSVAQHSIYVYNFMYEDKVFDKRKLLLGLLHDAPEAYIADMVKPLKVHLPFYCEVEDRIMGVICDKYGLNFEVLKEVKEYDIAVQKMEYETFFKGKSYFHGMSPEESLESFLGIYESLILQIKEENA